MGFYDTYITVINSANNTPIELRDSGFRKMLVETEDQNMELVVLLSQSVINSMKKPQRLLHDDEDYYIAIDLFTNTYYICYRCLMMIDIDYYKSDHNKQDIIKTIEAYCQEYPEVLFRLYSSRNGVHAFLISNKMDYKSPDTINTMLRLGSDFYYTVYTYIRGWSVRLNKKEKDTDNILYKHICDLGTGTADPYLEKLVDLHLNLVHTFKDTGTNTMHGD